MSTETISNQAVPAGTWEVDPVHSSVAFSVTHNDVSTFRGSFGSYEARLTGGESPRLQGTVDVASVDIGEEMLKGHLLSPDFFDVEKHPRLEFGSSELSVGEDGSLRLIGELEIRGERRRVEAAGRFAQLGSDLAGKARAGLSVEVTVDRRDFGLAWQAQLPSGGDVLDYTVTISVDLELTAAE